MVDGLRERKKRATRRAISDAATALFMKKGFDNTSVAEVAEAVGVSPQTVLNYFPAKTDLFFDEENWYEAPPQAIRDAGPGRPPGQAVLEWYLSDLARRHSEGHLDGLAVYQQTIADSATLRRRRLDDLAELTAALQTALDDVSPCRTPWDSQLTAAILTSAVMVAESETARLSSKHSGASLLRAAQAAATSIFTRTSDALTPPTNHERPGA
jgi:AcrR family transcriptional regulator